MVTKETLTDGGQLDRGLTLWQDGSKLTQGAFSPDWVRIGELEEDMAKGGGELEQARYCYIDRCIRGGGSLVAGREMLLGKRKSRRVATIQKSRSGTDQGPRDQAYLSH